MSCSFSSTRTSIKCTEPVNVTYGDQGFCKKHSISVQALLVKQNHTPSRVHESAAAPKVSKKIYDLTIKRNRHGNFTDEKTNIVFNPISKRVIGYEDEDGDVQPLDDEHKLICVKRKWEIQEDDSSDESSDENRESSSSEDESS